VKVVCKAPASNWRVVYTPSLDDVYVRSDDFGYYEPSTMMEIEPPLGEYEEGKNYDLARSMRDISISRCLNIFTIQSWYGR